MKEEFTDFRDEVSIFGTILRFDLRGLHNQIVPVDDDRHEDVDLVGIQEAATHIGMFSWESTTP